MESRITFAEKPKGVDAVGIELDFSVEGGWVELVEVIEFVSRCVSFMFVFSDEVIKFGFADANNLCRASIPINGAEQLLYPSIEVRHSSLDHLAFKWVGKQFRNVVCSFAGHFGNNGGVKFKPQ